MKQKILLATTNKFKILMFKHAWEKKCLNNWYELITLYDLTDPNKIEVVEDTGSFEMDALKKAKEYFKAYHIPTISMDQGFGINSLGGWPGTETKKVLSGDDKQIFDINTITEKLSTYQLDLKRAEAVLKKIPSDNRNIECYHGIALVLSDEDYVTELVTVKGKASDRLQIGEFGYFYDWFFIPEGYNYTFSQMKKDEYLNYMTEVVWPIPTKIEEFLLNKINKSNDK